MYTGEQDTTGVNVNEPSAGHCSMCTAHVVGTPGKCPIGMFAVGTNADCKAAAITTTTLPVAAAVAVVVVVVVVVVLCIQAPLCWFLFHLQSILAFPFSGAKER